MNAHPSLSFAVRDPRLLLLAVTLCACGIETEPRRQPTPGGTLADAGPDGGDAGTGDAGMDGSAGRGGRGGSAGAKAGTGGGAGSEAPEAGSSGEGASGTDGSAGTEEPECDEDESPKDEPCLIADQYAVFVSADGVLGASGTHESPLPTLSAGIAEAVSSGLKRVIVCADAYPEAVEITAGVSVYGGFSCEDGEWEYTGGATVVQPGTPGEALKITDVSDPVLLQDLEFEAKDAVGTGASSIAAVVKGSQAVVLKGVKLKAGKGTDGADGVLVPYAFPNTGATGDLCTDGPCLAGYNGVNSSGGPDRPGTCPGGATSVGGLGGANEPGGARSGLNGTPDRGVPTAGIGGMGGATCANGSMGAAGGNGSAGVGAAAFGEIADDAWVPGPGMSGQSGQVGQGGGGGGAQSGDGGGGGGGGGAGGCGGAGAGGGQGGGASIAVLVLDSSVLISDCALEVDTAGDGGAGVQGQDGMTSGGVSGQGHDQACNGGRGGAGGKGGAGGGGAGGVSAGVVWTGSQPAIEDPEYQLGTPGVSGQGGDSGSTADDGVAGAAHEVLEV